MYCIRLYYRLILLQLCSIISTQLQRLSLDRPGGHQQRQVQRRRRRRRHLSRCLIHAQRWLVTTVRAVWSTAARLVASVRRLTVDRRRWMTDLSAALTTTTTRASVRWAQSAVHSRNTSANCTMDTAVGNLTNNYHAWLIEWMNDVAYFSYVRWKTRKLSTANKQLKPMPRVVHKCRCGGLQYYDNAWRKG